MSEKAEVAERGDQRRQRLSRERVVGAALAIADADGLGALTIRSLATELGVKPMSVYYHVAGKDDILAALEGQAGLLEGEAVDVAVDQGVRVGGQLGRESRSAQRR